MDGPYHNIILLPWPSWPEQILRYLTTGVGIPLDLLFNCSIGTIGTNHSIGIIEITSSIGSDIGTNGSNE